MQLRLQIIGNSRPFGTDAGDCEPAAGTSKVRPVGRSGVVSGATIIHEHEVAWEVRKGLMALEPGEDVLSVFRDVIVPRLCDRDAGAGAGADACRLWAGRQADAYAGGGRWEHNVITNQVPIPSPRGEV